MIRIHCSRGLTLHRKKANPEHVRSRLDYALFASRNVIRWLDGKAGSICEEGEARHIA